jgi:hypothetical protein
MPISSLSRFTVPVSTDASSPTQGLLMPKLQYRFRVTLFDFGVGGAPLTELTKQVMTVDRPHPEFDEIPLHVYNSTVKLAGKHKFSNLKLKLRDDMTNAVTNIVGAQLQKQFDFYEQSSAVSGLDYKFTMIIEILDGGNGQFVPVTLEAFEVQGCWIKTATYGSVDYSKSEAMEIELEICFDNAVQTNAVGQLQGLGATVQRTFGTTSIGG